MPMDFSIPSEHSKARRDRFREESIFNTKEGRRTRRPRKMGVVDVVPRDPRSAYLILLQSHCKKNCCPGRLASIGDVGSHGSGTAKDNSYGFDPFREYGIQHIARHGHETPRKFYTVRTSLVPQLRGLPGPPLVLRVKILLASPIRSATDPNGNGLARSQQDSLEQQP